MTAMSLVTLVMRMAPSSAATRNWATRAGSQSRRTRPAALAPAKRLGEPRPPLDEDLGQSLAKPLVHVRQLGGQVAHGAAAHAVAPALVLEDAVEERVDLRDRVARGIGERGLEGALEEAPHHPVDDRVAQVFLALEVVVEVPLADAALPQDVVERGAVVALQVDEPGGGVQDLVAGRGALALLVSVVILGLCPLSRRVAGLAVPTSRYTIVACIRPAVKFFYLYALISISYPSCRQPGGVLHLSIYMGLRREPWARARRG